MFFVGTMGKVEPEYIDTSFCKVRSTLNAEQAGPTVATIFVF
jgi:hypothetical protein